MQKRIEAFFTKIKSTLFGSEKTLARKAAERATRPLNKKHYFTDANGSVRRNFEKPTPKKVRSKMRRLAKRKAAIAA